MTKLFPLLLLLSLLSSCSFFEKKNTVPIPETGELALTKLPDFNTDSAYHYVQSQVDFGPRVPNSIAHDRAAAWIAAKFHLWADTVIVQHYTAKAWDGLAMKSQNIIASFNPQASSRVLITAHWDSRPIADEDDHDMDKPIDAANDGASSIGIMLEMARAMQQQRPKLGVDFILFDSEDYGQPENTKGPKVPDSWCLGSQYWGAKPHVAGYKADFGINLDMVGSADAVFLREGVSVQYADWVSQYVWKIAARLGYSSRFQNRVYGAVTDDHYYVNTLAHIPTIDLIHYDERGFGKYHHTHNDNMTIIDRNTLGTVGKVMLQTIYQYEAEQGYKTKMGTAKN